ncbi:peptidoglycan-binding domain-containing protein [Nannocystis sp. ILAH1]|uniref:peptidoglycan-binding domain-containing protein n=1 Tax=unclassified Nannocystis TaxID=2627009 RepID=UPI00226D9A17|nr:MULTISPECIES: peptidoglycan-binding domain-containing protein [unclassified Nannocystis]MCY0991004.1 peptidoglycan-binding domain-containing protein [Nannocystis sp. ILAH1]MCY1064509.1 peptidoglycan-binding domain-containing protein [Nannocystis sp. RBIL2]
MDEARRIGEDARFIDATWVEEDDVPWEEDDGEDDLGGVQVDFFAFAGALDIDDGSDERWLQSCLRELVAPDLVVDGALGGRTRQAIRAFQRRVRQLRPGAQALTVDGIAGPANSRGLIAASKPRRACPGGANERHRSA